MKEQDLAQTKYVEPFLLKNGFRKQEDGTYKNQKCTVIFQDYGYDVHFEDGMSSVGSTKIYCLIGYLTYNELMNKNYKV